MKRGTIRHPKTMKLARLLNLTRRDTLGLLEMLIEFVIETCPAGDIGRWDDETIAEAVDFEGDPAALIKALCECGPKDHFGFLQRDDTHRLLVHDWADHIPEWLRKRIVRGELKLLVPTVQTEAPSPAPLSGQVQTAAPPPALPCPTMPSPAQPSFVAKATRAKAEEKPRARNPLFDILATLFFGGTVRKPDAPLVGKLAADLKEHGATPDEVRRRFQTYKDRHPDWTLTPTALVKHWASLGLPGASGTDDCPRLTPKAEDVRALFLAIGDPRYVAAEQERLAAEKGQAP